MPNERYPDYYLVVEVNTSALTSRHIEIYAVHADAIKARDGLMRLNGSPEIIYCIVDLTSGVKRITL